MNREAEPLKARPSRPRLFRPRRWRACGRQGARRNIEHRITCPVLAMLGAGEGPDLQSQTREFLDAVGSTTKTLYEFSPAVDGSDDHCQLDNRTRANIVMFDWLDEVCGGTPEKDPSG